MANPLLDGSGVLGTAAHSVHVPNPTETQVNTFFGVNGEVTLFGGTRGRTFEVDGVFTATTLAGIFAAEAALLSFADGNNHTYTDTQGRVWTGVQFRNEYTPDPIGPHPTGTGWCMAFRCVLRGTA